MQEQSIKKRKLSKYGGRIPMFRYDIKLLQERMAVMGLHTAELARKVAAKAVLVGDKPPADREIYTIMGGERPFPKPDYVRQIASVLDIPMSEIVLKIPTKAALEELTA